MNVDAEIQECASCIYFGKKFKNLLKEEGLDKIGIKGLNSIKDISKSKKDNFEVYLSQQQGQIYLHKSCRMKYYKPNNSSNETGVSKRKNDSSGSPTARTKLRLELDTVNFDFQKRCLICTKVINNNKSEHVSTVTSTNFAKEMCQQIIDKLKTQNDNIIALRKRILLNNLVANQARYHENCYKTLERDSHIKDEDDFMDKIYKRINEQKKVFYYEKLIEDLKEPDDVIPTVETVEEKIIKRFGKDSFVFLKKTGQPTMILSKDTMYEFCVENDREKNKTKEEKEAEMMKCSNIIQKDLDKYMKSKEPPRIKDVPETLITLLKRIQLSPNKLIWRKQLKVALKSVKITVAKCIICKKNKVGDNSLTCSNCEKQLRKITAADGTGIEDSSEDEDECEAAVNSVPESLMNLLKDMKFSSNNKVENEKQFKKAARNAPNSTLDKCIVCKIKTVDDDTLTCSKCEEKLDENPVSNIEVDSNESEDSSSEYDESEEEFISKKFKPNSRRDFSDIDLVHFLE